MNRRTERWAIPAVLALLIAGCAAQGPATSESVAPIAASTGAPVSNAKSVEGTTLTGPVDFSIAGFEGTTTPAPARTPYGPATSEGGKVIPFHRNTGLIDTAVLPSSSAASLSASDTTVASPVPAEASTLAPSLGTNFAGFGDDNTAIPPDTMGVIGPSHFFSILNNKVGAFTRTGTKLSETSLDSFWASVKSSVVFDPKALYDQYSGRFLVVTLDGYTPPVSRFLVGVSATSDPTGVWYRWSIPANQDNTSNWADFPGIGLDNANLYLTANMFDNTAFGNFQYAKAWVIPKAQLLSGSAIITRTEFSNPSGDGSDFTMQPAHAFGNTSAQYLVQEGFIIPPNRRLLRIASITSPMGSPVLTNLGYIEVAGYPIQSLPLAPQAGTFRRIETNDTRLLNAVLRNGTLWTTHTVADNTNSRTQIAWYQIDPSSAGTTVFGTPLQQGRISDPSRFYYYPSIAVNANGDVGVGFSGSSMTEFAGGYYTGRAVADTSGAMQAVSLLKAGLGPYYKTFSGTENRWGDYSATSVDPNDGLTFWTIQEYAAAPDNTWGTWVGTFAFPAPTPPTAPTGLTATAVSTTQVNLAWTDQSNNETGFTVERKNGSAGTYAVIATLAANITVYNDNSLTDNTTYFYRVKATNIAGDSSYSNEASATTPANPPPSSGGGGGCSIYGEKDDGTGFTPFATAFALLSPAVYLLIRRRRRILGHSCRK